MRLIAGENKTTYAAHQSPPARGEKRREPSPYPRVLAAPFRVFFSEASRQPESFLGRKDNKTQRTKNENERTGRERVGEVVGGMREGDV